MSRSHVDVYFPRHAIAQAELGLLPFRPPPSASHPIDRGAYSSSRLVPHAKPAPTVDGTHWDVRSPSTAAFHEQYHPLGEIEGFVRDLAAAYPRQVSIVPLGHSGEGREMFALEITAGASTNSRSHDPNSQVVLNRKGKGKENAVNLRRGFLITGAQHAREVGPFALSFSGCWLKNGRQLLVDCLCFRVVHRTRSPG